MQHTLVCVLNCSLACEQALLFGQAKRVSRERASQGPRKGFAARSHVLARLASLAQIGELARRLFAHLNFQLQNLNFTAEFNILDSSFRVHVLHTSLENVFTLVFQLLNSTFLFNLASCTFSTCFVKLHSQTMQCSTRQTNFYTLLLFISFDA